MSSEASHETRASQEHEQENSNEDCTEEGSASNRRTGGTIARTITNGSDRIA
jgi:hypothetical protein